MKKVYFLSILTIIFSLFSQMVSAEEHVGSKKGNGKEIKGVTAGCLEATSYVYLELNNVRAMISNGGDMWEFNGNASYEVPKGTGHHALYAGAIWVGGTDTNGQLRIAALTFRSQGIDYWPGPLVARGDNKANVTPNICTRYDRHYYVTRNMVSEFIGYINSENREADYPGYVIPEVISDWPAHGPIEDEYDTYLAPFKDVDGDHIYNPGAGDYPYYIFESDYDCNQVPERNADSLDNEDMQLYGDATLWWVYNDKGNIHTRTSGAAIGMEFRAQAFAFSTNDELNNMTFYNYQIINRSTYSLNNAYFGIWTDADLGYAWDDNVGCDVNRGLGYLYNGLESDDGGTESYGPHPPAVGIDFFEGPYQDANDFDDPTSWGPDGNLDCSNGYRYYEDGTIEVIPPATGNIFDNGNINGLNFGDGIADNERWGMRAFLYHNNGSGDYHDPDIAIDFYRYMRGFWKNGNRMTYGGAGHDATDVEADFMFPGTTDPCWWGTGGIIPSGYEDAGWVQEDEPTDRRFIQAAGPFTLEPGQVNNITTGAVWARANNASAIESVYEVQKADDKAQSLFENCFQMIDGPDAPDVTIIEMENKFIFHLSNAANSNNFLEQYSQEDIFIPTVDSLNWDKYYRFQGYQVFQLQSSDVTLADLYNENLSKVVFQCDIEDDVEDLVNYEYDKELGATLPQKMVDAANNGISHTFEITQDLFSTAATNKLVNNKKYYYVVIAYAYNSFKKYDQNDASALDGQKTPYLPSRKAATGGIKVFEVIPHAHEMDNDGTQLNAEYGDQPAITRLEGYGNGNNYLKLAEGVEERILNGEDLGTEIPYETNHGPVQVKIIDPLSVRGGDYYLGIHPDSVNYEPGHFNPNETYPQNLVPGDGFILDGKWFLAAQNDAGGFDTTYALSYLSDLDEYVFPEFGISISMQQIKYPDGFTSGFGFLSNQNNGYVGASLTYEDEVNPWLNFLSDEEGTSPFNWIRVGTNSDSEYGDYGGRDNDQYFESILEKTWAPYAYGSTRSYGPTYKQSGPTSIIPSTKDVRFTNVDFVITSDRSLWTRCPVLEMAENSYNEDSVEINPNSQGEVLRFSVRHAPSVDKDGYTDVGSGPSNDPASPNYISDSGMSWFPGYAIDVETGRRLNMAFGEDSWLVGANGRDMLWNPTKDIYSQDGNLLLGGKHYIYIFANDTSLITKTYMPPYDNGAKLIEKFTESSTSLASYMRFASWVSIPYAKRGFEFQTYDSLPDNELRIELRVANAYNTTFGYIIASGAKYFTDFANPTPQNDNYPLFHFNLDQYVPETGVATIAEEALERINIVPNPYKGGNDYELTPLERVVKLINLPKTCNIKIYNMAGTLVRSFEKDNSSTIIEWDLTNNYRIPIAGGVYIIHIEVPGVGEKVLKWFGVLRPEDLTTF